MVATVDYYRYYVPTCRQLNVTVLATATIGSQSVNEFNMVYNNQTTTNLGFTPYGTDFVDVFANGVNVTNKVIDEVQGGYTYSYFSVSGSTLTWIKKPTVGANIKIVSYLNGGESAFARIDLTDQLIQGIIANNTDPTFTGSVECYPVIVHQPINGFVRIAWDRQGFEYSLKAGAPTGDSFAYKLVSRYGQESEPRCIMINQGV